MRREASIKTRDCDAWIIGRVDAGRRLHDVTERPCDGVDADALWRVHVEWDLGRHD